MRRREFVTLTAGAMAFWPVAARGQQVPIIGFLSSISVDQAAAYLPSFRSGLDETGFIDGQNVSIEFRWADGHYDRLPSLATELLRYKPAVLVAIGGPNSGRAAKAVTATIPIVFMTGDAVREGLVQSLNRPGRQCHRHRFAANRG